MIVIQLVNTTLILGGRPIFTDLTWSIQHDQKIGLIGPNGAGKSSLFKLMVGEYTPEPGGNLIKAKGVTLGYLAQQPELPLDQTVLAAALSGNPRWHAVQAELERIETSLASPQVYNNPKVLERTLEEQHKHLEEYFTLGGDTYPDRVREILSGLGLAQEDFDKPMGVLSGGQKKLVGLACLMLAKPDVLLLDEPDNHLDLAGKIFLERLIREYLGTVVIVSHDRYLLDAVVTHIVEIEDGRLTTFTGDYSMYVIEKGERLARQEELYQIQQREIGRLQMALKRYSLWAEQSDKFASRIHAMEARLARVEQCDRPVLERRRMGLKLNGWRGSNKVLELVDLEKTYGRQTVIERVNALIWHGERVGLIGANGAGKSVLLRLILGIELPDLGEIRLGPSVTVGYYAQEHETLNLEQTLIDTVRRASPLSESGAVAFLNRYLFPYSRVNQKVQELSGGERSRLQLALLVLSGANFLLLDEPTNNLDIASAEVLENALADFIGTVLVISHDRYFLDRVVSRIWLLEDGNLVEYPGGYSDYLQQKVADKSSGK
jgi:ATP-binding cassette subfamily F protein 3